MNRSPSSHICLAAAPSRTIVSVLTYASADVTLLSSGASADAVT